MTTDADRPAHRSRTGTDCPLYRSLLSVSCFSTSSTHAPNIKIPLDFSPSPRPTWTIQLSWAIVTLANSVQGPQECCTATGRCQLVSPIPYLDTMWCNNSKTRSRCESHKTVQRALFLETHAKSWTNQAPTNADSRTTTHVL